MTSQKTKKKGSFFERASLAATKATGSTPAFVSAFSLVLGWAITGPMFDYSETWQLFINTLTTIVTFLMVFLIQKAQNKDSLAIQLKLDELVASYERASNRLIDVEGMTEEEMEIMRKYYSKLSRMAKNEQSLQQSHSIEEAHKKHEEKAKLHKKPKK
jgi:low affinity Fe/Cu permease